MKSLSCSGISREIFSTTCDKLSGGNVYMLTYVKHSVSRNAYVPLFKELRYSIVRAEELDAFMIM